HSLPTPTEEMSPDVMTWWAHVYTPFGSLTRTQGPSPDTLSIKYGNLANSVSISPTTNQIIHIKDGLKYRMVAPHHDLLHPWDAPFFYEDRRHVFYITPTGSIVTILDWSGGPLTVSEEPGSVIAKLVPPALRAPMGPDDYRPTRFAQTFPAGNSLPMGASVA